MSKNGVYNNPQPREPAMPELAKSTVLDGADLNAALATRVFPRVTPDSISAKIASVSYHSMGDVAPTVTVCNITMMNGYSVRGESACVDPRNYDQQIGQSIAYKNAFEKLWPLEGYLLAETMANDAKTDAPGT